jgi:glycosyltransferase involved in cell wall biosynthesis
VLMPVYNESETLQAIISRVLAAPVDLDIDIDNVCVDDDSADNSLNLLNELASADPGNLAMKRSMPGTIRSMRIR